MYKKRKNFDRKEEERRGMMVLKTETIEKYGVRGLSFLVDCREANEFVDCREALVECQKRLLVQSVQHNLRTNRTKRGTFLWPTVCAIVPLGFTKYHVKIFLKIAKMF